MARPYLTRAVQVPAIFTGETADADLACGPSPPGRPRFGSTFAVGVFVDCGVAGTVVSTAGGAMDTDGCSLTEPGSGGVDRCHWDEMASSADNTRIPATVPMASLRFQCRVDTPIGGRTSISESASRRKWRSVISNAWLSVNEASSAGRSTFRGMTAPATSTGITGSIRLQGSNDLHSNNVVRIAEAPASVFISDCFPLQARSAPVVPSSPLPSPR